MVDQTELANAIRASAQRLGIDPSDFATAISYETAGTMDPWQKGPTTQHGEHRGLIQWGEPQRKKYGVYEGMPVADQLVAAEKYLIDAGVKPGHGLLDVYSAINSGRVGRYNASDANNGGAPGTVADKVASQMYGHRLKANRLLGIGDQTAATNPVAPAATPGAVSAAPAAAPTDIPFGLAPAGAPAAVPDMSAAIAAAQQSLQDDQPKFSRIEHPEMAFINKNRRRLAAAAARGAMS